MDNGARTVLAALGGAIIGAGIALLFAPASGKETREKIGEKLTDTKENIQDKSQELYEKAKTKGRETYDNVKEKVSSMTDDIADHIEKA